MKKFINICIALCLLAILFAGLYFDGNIVFTCKSDTYSISSLGLAACACALLLVIFGICKIAFVCEKLFSKRNNISSIVDEIQLVLSSILLKDLITSEKHIKKVEKSLSNTSLLCWLKGNIELLRGDTHKAKSLFYSASAAEEKSSLGVYSLCRLAVQTKDKVTEVETLRTILNTFGYQEGAVLRLLTIALQNHDFAAANDYIRMIDGKKKNKRLHALVLYNEALANPLKAEELLKSAFELAPEISQIAMEYSKILVANQDLKKAKSVLAKTWKLSPHPDVFYQYLNLDIDTQGKIEDGYELTTMSTYSWVGYFEYGKFLLDSDKLNDSFCNLLAAYGKCRYRCVFDSLRHVCELLPDPKPVSASEILSGRHDSEIIDGDIGWHCRNCGCVYSKWQSICDKCEAIDSVHWEDYKNTSHSTELQLLN